MNKEELPEEYMAQVDGAWICPKCGCPVPFGGQIHHHADGSKEWIYGGPAIGFCPLCDRRKYNKEIKKINEEFNRKSKSVK